MLLVVDKNGIRQALPLDGRQAEVARAQHAPRTLQSMCSFHLRAVVAGGLSFLRSVLR